jgi:antitoxin component HigA of HigAB toxin-antitoxin module
MTATLNPTTYGKLLAQFQPQPLETSEDYRSARLAILNLLKKGQLSHEENLIKLIALLMREYDLHQPQPLTVKPNEILEHSIEANGIVTEDLAIQIGGEEILSEIIDGSRDISPQQAQILAEIFKVSSTLFRIQ